MQSSWEEMGPLKLAAIPQNLLGMTVLDIGGYDGRFAYECLLQGARNVVVVDNGQWRLYNNGIWRSPEQFEGVTYHEMDFMFWQTPANIVLFYNVLYHLAPGEGVKALKKLRELTRDKLCLSTYFAPNGEGWVDYPETGTGLQCSTPSLPALLLGLQNAGFEVEQLKLKDTTVVLRAR